MAAVQIQYILYRHNGKYSRRSKSHADEVPSHISAVYVQITAVMVFFRFCGSFVPAPCGVVVVGAGVHDAVFVTAVRQISIVFIIAESKLQYTHAGEACFFSESTDFIGDDAQVFGDERKFAQRFFNGFEEIHAGTFFPFPNNGVFRTEFHFPMAFKGTKVVDAQIVHVFQCLVDAFCPPEVASFLVGFPVIKRVAPKLTFCTEIIGRYPCHNGGEAHGVQLEQFLVCPYVRTVIRHENGCVPHDGDAFFVGISLQCLPLGEEQILIEFFFCNGICQQTCPFFQAGCVALAQCAGPCVPAGRFEVIFLLFFCEKINGVYGKGEIFFFVNTFGTFRTEMCLQSGEQGEIRQPHVLFFTESGKVRLHIFVCFCAECFISLVEQGQFVCLYGVIVYPFLVKSRDFSQIFCGQKPHFHQFVRADEQDVPGKS